MVRQARMAVPHVPHHIIQRGHNRQPCFLDEYDYRRYLQQLLETTSKFDCLVHAYVLMPNHAHLLITPQWPHAISGCMQALGRRYATYFNRTHRRSGTLWDGRYKSCLVESQMYLLTCHQYIELNPVRADMVASPADYRWTSHHSNALGRPDPLIQPHPEYLALGTSPEERQAAYRDLFHNAIDADRLAAIRIHLQQQRALGTRGFQKAWRLS
jgi:putative transposase